MSFRPARCGHQFPSRSAASIAHLPRGLAWVSLILLLLVAVSKPGECGEPESGGRSIHSPAKPLVELVAIGETHAVPKWTFVVCHGMGGMKTGDRFHQLAETILENRPQANVFLVDWSEAANKQVWGINIPQLVAKSINPVSQDVAEQLKSLDVDTAKLTMIGESFGNCVNNQVARRLGGVNRILAFNPANELGGYPLPHLEKHSEIAWAFHSRSPFDTNSKISDRGILLQPASEDPYVQHTYGVQWLQQRLSDGDASWLNFERVVPAAPTAKLYDLAIDKDGSLDFAGALRTPPEPETTMIASSSSAKANSP